MPRDDDKLNTPKRKGDDESLDFGAFVSSNVQRTSDLLKGEPGTPPQQPASAPSRRPGGERKVEQARDRSYWRRKAAGAGIPDDELEEEAPPPPPQRSRRNRYLPQDTDEADQFHEENEFGDQGSGFGGFFTDFLSGDGEDGNRNRIIAAIIALIILILIIFGITRLIGGDDSGDGGDVTPVATEIIDTTSTPGADGPIDLTTDGTETPAVTEEPEIPRGGDNQRGEGDGGGETPAADTGPTEIAVADLTSEVARACSGLCLVRMEGPNQAAAIEEAGGRVSWADGDISWIVVNPTQAEVLDRDLTLTFIENDPRTYNLYMVKAAEDHNQRDVVSPHGTIIDESGRYYLVRWNGVPAVVKPVTDWGYAVFKIAPAPPTTIAKVGTNGPASEASGANLMAKVDQGNVEDVVDELSHIGELDNSGLGTRYYTFPGNQIAADYLFQELESYGLTVWYEDFIMWDGYLLVNVVAEIPGNDDSEVYAMMAHFDSINLDNPRTAPGADDNASGIAVTLETARILAGYELEHPIQIAFVNAEEVGIIGAPAWAREQNRKDINIVGVFNVDSVGSIRNRPVVITNATGTSVWMQQHMSSVNEKYGLMETFDHHQSENIVADDNFVRDEGIPAVMIARELYGLNEFHHTNQDVMENVSVGGIVDTTYLVMLSIWELAG